MDKEQNVNPDSANIATLNDAIAIAAVVHKGQFDKAGAPYIFHPLRMMMKMDDDTARIVAVLHDVVEDSAPEDKWDFERLRNAGFSEEVIEAVNCVTEREGESYEDFIERASANPIARKVKIADLEDNMNMLRLDAVNDRSLARVARYHRSWKRLTSIKQI